MGLVVVAAELAGYEVLAPYGKYTYLRRAGRTYGQFMSADWSDAQRAQVLAELLEKANAERTT